MKPHLYVIGASLAESYVVLAGSGVIGKACYNHEALWASLHELMDAATYAGPFRLLAAIDRVFVDIEIIQHANGEVEIQT